jgi:hypothetical protein
MYNSHAYHGHRSIYFTSGSTPWCFMRLGYSYLACLEVNLLEHFGWDVVRGDLNVLIAFKSIIVGVALKRWPINEACICDMNFWLCSWFSIFLCIRWYQLNHVLLSISLRLRCWCRVTGWGGIDRLAAANSDCMCRVCSGRQRCRELQSCCIPRMAVIINGSSMRCTNGLINGVVALWATTMHEAIAEGDFS